MSKIEELFFRYEEEDERVRDRVRSSFHSYARGLRGLDAGQVTKRKFIAFENGHVDLLAERILGRKLLTPPKEPATS